MKYALAASILAALSSPALAQDLPIAALSALPLLGNERLTAFALSRPQMGPRGLEAALNAYYQGGYIAEAGAVTRKSLRAAPVLQWDNNLNGGSASDTFFFAGLPFRVNQNTLAKAGLLLGGSVSGTARVNMADGLALDLRGSAMLGYAPAHEISKSLAQASACLRYMVSTENHLHGCADWTQSRYELGETRRKVLRLGYARELYTSGGYHEISAELLRTEFFGETGYGQNGVALGTASALNGGYALTTRLQLAEGAERRQVMRRRAEVSLSTLIKDRRASLSLSVQETSGGRFLGVPREERTYGLGLDLGVSQKVSVSAYYAQTDSNHAFFDADAYALSVDYRF